MDSPQYQRGKKEFLTKKTFDRSRPSRPSNAGNNSFNSNKPQFSGLIKKLARLKYDKGRLEASQFLIEGPKIIKDILNVSKGIIKEVFTGPEFSDTETLSLIRKHGIPVTKFTQDEMTYLADTQANQGLIGVAYFSTLKPNWASARYITLVDRVQDPGNVGAIFRTSLALGMDAVLLGKGSCEAYNPKVVRSSVGAMLRTPFESGVDLESKISFLRQKGFTILATSSHTSFTLETVKLRKKVALIISNEGEGIDERTLSLADATIKIPLKNEMESLNVSVAHGILCHQIINSRD